MKRLFSILLLIATGFGMLPHNVADARGISTHDLYRDKWYTDITDLSVSLDGKVSFKAKDSKNNAIMVKEWSPAMPDTEFVPPPVYPPMIIDFSKPEHNPMRTYDSLDTSAVFDLKSYRTTGIPPVKNTIYSGDGKHFAFFARDNDDCVLVKDGAVINRAENMWKFSWLHPQQIRFSHDGKHLAYIWPLMYATIDYFRYIVKDSESIMMDFQYRSILDFGYSPDGNNFFTITEQLRSNQPATSVVFNLDMIDDNYSFAKDPSFSSNGKYFVFTAGKYSDQYGFKTEEFIVLIDLNGIQSSVKQDVPTPKLTPLQTKLSALIEQKSAGDLTRKSQIITTLQKNLDRVIAKETNTKKMALLQELRAFLYQ